VLRHIRIRSERAWEIGCAEGISAVKAIRRSPSSCLHGRNGCRECIGAQHAPRRPGAGLVVGI
jgi:hypothetical protein